MCNRFAVILLAMATWGCQPAETISSYDSPRRSPPREIPDVSEFEADMDHMLTAMAPQGKSAWFFKLEGKAAEIDAARPAWNAFLESLQLVDQRPDQQQPDERPDAEAQATLPVWKLPEGWKQRPGDGMRAATLEVPARGARLELSVTRLPMTEPFEPYLVRNVNRWLGQLQQGEMSEAAIKNIAQRRVIAGVDGAVVELRGFRPSGRPMATAQLPDGHPPIDAGSTSVGADATPPAGESLAGDASSTSDGSRQEGLRPPDGAVSPKGASKLAAGARATDASGSFTYATPDGWRRMASTSMRLAAFEAGDEATPALITVTAFPKVASMADPLINAQRWAGQISERPLEDAELTKLITDVEAAGVPGKRFEYLGSESDKRGKGMMVVMFERAGKVWFFKMSGPNATIVSQRDAFDALLKSVEFKK